MSAQFIRHGGLDHRVEPSQVQESPETPSRLHHRSRPARSHRSRLGRSRAGRRAPVPLAHEPSRIETIETVVYCASPSASPFFVPHAFRQRRRTPAPRLRQPQRSAAQRLAKTVDADQRPRPQCAELSDEQSRPRPESFAIVMPLARRSTTSCPRPSPWCARSASARSICVISTCNSSAGWSCTRAGSRK